MNFEAHLREQRARIEVSLRGVLERWRDQVEPSAHAAISHGVLGGGKRLRAILCTAAYRAASGAGPDPELSEFACSLELIHAYSLMHDDLPCMDDAELRRGRPTTHRIHGVDETTRAGAALIPLAVHTALSGALKLGCSERQAEEAARTLCRGAGAGGMVGGQALDLLGESGGLEFEAVQEIHTLKTGALLAASLSMGAVAAGAPEGVRDALEGYGRAIGLAFQIADDLLDATATAEQLGKLPSDADLGKTTYVTVHGVDRARELAEDEVDRAERFLTEARLEAPLLSGLARYIVDRRH